MLSTNYDDIGFAVSNGVIDGYETTIVVQMFGRERKPLAAAPVELTPQPEANIAEEPIPVSEPEPLAVNLEESAPSKEFIENEEPALEVEGDVTPILQQITKSENITEEQGPNNVFFDVKTATKAITYTFGGFLLLLMAIDMWYSRSHGILKLTGHTFAHIVFLAVALLSVVLSIVPGAIL